MGWRLRRSFNIARGVRLNISKSGIGVSAGAKGARVGVGPRGAYTSVSVPGTGLYRVDYMKSGRASTKRARNPDPSSAQALQIPFVPARKPVVFFWPNLMMLAGIAGLLWGFFADNQTILGGGFALSLASVILWFIRRRDPRWLAWKWLQGGKRVMKEDLREAAGLLQRAATGPAAIDEAKFYAGIVFHDLDEHEKAIQYLGEFDCSTVPEFTIVYADSLHKAGRFDELVSFLQKNTLVFGAEDKDLTPHEAQAITLLGLGFAEKGDHATAIEVYERVTRRRKMDPQMAVLRYAYARSLEATGDMKGAVREFRKVTAFDVGIADASERLMRLETGNRTDPA